MYKNNKNDKLYCLNKIFIDSQFTKLHLNCRYQDSIFYKIKIM